MSELRFVCYGTPEPQGSTRAFIPKGWKRPIITSDNKDLKSWRQEVTKVAQAAAFEAEGVWHLNGETPIEVEMHFFFQAPKSSKRKDGPKTTRPDLSKLLRAVEDSLTGTVIHDDSQIAACHCFKSFGTPQRCEIVVRTLELPRADTPRSHGPQARRGAAETGACSLLAFE